MTTERIRSIGILTATFIAGILLGVLVPGLVHKIGERLEERNEKTRGHDSDRKGDWFVHTLNKVFDPDSAQREKIRPITTRAAARLDTIEQIANRDAARVLDSVRIQLRPILNADQWQRLDKFDRKAKSKLRRGEGRH